MITFIIIITFLLVYFLMDVLHDSWSNKEKDYATQASAYHSVYGSTPHYKVLCDKSLKWNKHKHMIDAWIKAMVVGMLSYAFMSATHTGWDLVIWIAKYALLGGSVRWLWFDSMWNIIHKHSFWYRGTVAATDTIKIPDWIYFSLKFILLIISIILVV